MMFSLCPKHHDVGVASHEHCNDRVEIESANDMERGYASSTSSLSDDDFGDDLTTRESIIMVSPDPQASDHADVCYVSDRGWKLLQALDEQSYYLIDHDAMMRQQRDIERKERSHTTIVSCTILIGVFVVFVWVYFFGLVDQDAYQTSP